MLTLNEMMDRGFSRPVRVIHTLCGGILFFHDGIPTKEFAPLDPEKIILFNGATPKAGDPIICTHCGYDVRTNQMEFVLNDD